MGVRGAGHKIDGNLRGLLVDTKTWVREGLIDSFVATGYYRDGGNSKLAYEWFREETEGLVDIWLLSWVPQTPEAFDSDVALAGELGVGQILYWEGDYIDAYENKAALQTHMSSFKSPGEVS